MKVFYVAKSFSGENKSGEMDVKNDRELAAQLRSEGFILMSFKELNESEDKKVKIKFLDRFSSVSLKERLMFTQNLAVMISSGLPLSRAIKNISLQLKSKKFREILDGVFQDIQSGTSFSDSLAKYPGIFEELYVNMIRVGETSGNLEEILGILAVQLEKEHDLRSKVRGAMTYPAVILVAMVGIAILMLTYILPKITAVFKDMGGELPATTKFVISLSDALINHGFAVAVGCAMLGMLLKVALTTQGGKKAVGFLVINTPVIKNIVIKINCARFSRIYSSLLKSGVTVVAALNILSNTLTNYYYKNIMLEAVEQVQKGETLSKVIGAHEKVFPILVTQMIEVGEETGKTEVVLLKLAEFYEDEVTQISKNLSSIIEPVLMIFIGTAVGFFAISMLQPMYSLMDNIK